MGIVMSSSPVPLIYIAGPFRGPTPIAVRRNVEHARDLGLLVAECGGYPIIPHTMTAEFDKLLTDDFWLAGTMELLKRCDGIVLAANWETSKGAQAEWDYALSVNMPRHIAYVTLTLAAQRQALTTFVDSVRRRLQVRDDLPAQFA